MLICCLRNISDYYQCWKQLCCTVFLWKSSYMLFFRIHRWIESWKEQHLFEIEIFSNIINVFTVTFDQFNASLINKSINFRLILDCLTGKQGKLMPNIHCICLHSWNIMKMCCDFPKRTSSESFKLFPHISPMTQIMSNRATKLCEKQLRHNSIWSRLK